jgi:hypothetical protein
LVSGFTGIPAYASPDGATATDGVFSTEATTPPSDDGTPPGEGNIATEADVATEADLATEADFATEADYATEADIATEAVVATEAAVATQAIENPPEPEPEPAPEPEPEPRPEPEFKPAPVAAAVVSQTLIAPGSITVTKSGEAALLSWSKVAGAAGYIIYRGVDSGALAQYTAVAAETYTDSNLVSGHIYTYKVAAFSADGRIGYDSAVVAFDYKKTPPLNLKPAPKNLKPALVKKAGAFSVQLKWKAAGEGDAYKLYRKLKTEKDADYVLVFGGEQGTSALTGTDYTTLPGLTYSYALSAVNADGTETKRGAVLNVKTAAVTKPKVSSVKAVPANRLNATIKWAAAKPVENAFISHYQIFRQEPGEDGFSSVTGNYAIDQISKTLTDYNVEPGKTYSYKVVSTWQIPGEKSTDPLRTEEIESPVYKYKSPALPKVSGLKAAAANATGITLSWKKLGAGEDGYEVLLYKAVKNKIDGEPIKKEYTQKNTMPFTNIPYGDYIITVRAKWMLTDISLPLADREVFGTLVKTGVVRPKAAAVTTLKVAVVNPYTVSVSWKALPAIKDTKTSYYLMRSSAKNKNVQKIAERDENQVNFTFTDTDIIPGDTYYYYVDIVYAPKGDEPVEEFMGKPSAKKTAKPTDKAPGKLRSSAVNATNFKLSWGAVAGADSYEVLVAGKLLDADTNSRTIRLADGMRICPNTTYTVQVRAVWGDKHGKYGSTVKVKTSGAAPKGLKKVSLVGTKVRLSWKSVDGASGYFVYKDGVRFADVTSANFNTADWIEDDSLQPGKAVKYTVQAYWNVLDDSNNTYTQMPGIMSAPLTVKPKA